MRSATGQISASVHDLTEAYEIERVGKGTILTLFGDIVKDFDTHIIFASDAMVNQKPASAARASSKAGFRRVAYMLKNKEAATVRINRQSRCTSTRSAVAQIVCPRHGR